MVGQKTKQKKLPTVLILQDYLEDFHKIQNKEVLGN